MSGLRIHADLPVIDVLICDADEAADAMCEVADRRVHGSTGQTPQTRFEQAEARALRPLDG